MWTSFVCLQRGTCRSSVLRIGAWGMPVALGPTSSLLPWTRQSRRDQPPLNADAPPARLRCSATLAGFSRPAEPRIFGTEFIASLICSSCASCERIHSLHRRSNKRRYALQRRAPASLQVMANGQTCISNQYARMNHIYWAGWCMIR
jgi:hypothetical protein